MRTFALLALLGPFGLAGCPGDPSGPVVLVPPSQPTAVGCTDGATQLCACTTGDLGAQVCDAAGAFGTCDCTTPPVVGGVTFLVEDADGSTATGVDTLHIVGTTDCIQPLGTVEITNETANEASVNLVVDGTFPQIVLAPAGTVAVAPNASSTVDITFDCGLLPVFPPEPVSTTITVSAADDAADAIQFPVVLLFEIPPE